MAKKNLELILATGARTVITGCPFRKIAPDFVELRHNRANALCCGAGGGVGGAYAKNSIGMARLRLEEVEEVGAEVLPTECNSCVHNLNSAKVRAQNFKIYTTPQFLNHLLKQSE